MSGGGGPCNYVASSELYLFEPLCVHRTCYHPDKHASMAAANHTHQLATPDIPECRHACRNVRTICAPRILNKTCQTMQVVRRDAPPPPRMTSIQNQGLTRASSWLGGGGGSIAQLTSLVRSKSPYEQSFAIPGRGV